MMKPLKEAIHRTDTITVMCSIGIGITKGIKNMKKACMLFSGSTVQHIFNIN